MRIVGGRFRGRRLKAPQGGATRPTSEKVREALFDILGARVDGALFVDLYAGTGAVGLEALSRGAGRVVAVENARGALAALRENAQALEADGPAWSVLPVGAARALGRLREDGRGVDILFCDPPYADPSWPALLAGLGGAVRWSDGALLVVEHAAKRAPECPRGFRPGRSYRYGDTGLTLFEWEGTEKTSDHVIA